MDTTNRDDHRSPWNRKVSPQNVPAAVSIGAGTYSIVAAALALVGWALNLPVLTDWTDQGISMFPNTAICAALAGAALIVQTATARLSGLVIARVLAGVIALIAGLTLIEHVTGFNLGIDTLLFDRPWGQSAASAPMRMGPPASTSYLILGTALVLATFGAQARIGATTLAILTAAIASLSLTGYWFGADQLFGIAKFTGIALNTSTVIAALSIGLMATVPEHGLVAALRRDDAGGDVHRRLVAPIVIVPLVLGWLRILGEQAGFYDAAFGTALRSLTEVILFFGLLWWTANSISRQASIAQKAHARISAIIETSEDAIISKSLDGVIETWNAGAERIFGYTTAEAIGKPITLVVPRELIEEEAEILARLRRGERIEQYETVRVTKDGRRIDVSLSISPLRDGRGNLIGASKIARDITGSKQAEIALRESEHRFSTFMQALPGLAWIKDLHGRYVFVNDAAQAPFGRPRNALYGKTDDELFPPETAAQFKKNDQAALSTPRGIEVIESLEHKDGIHYSIVSKFPILDAEGKAAYVGGVAIDITERMRAEEALRQADRRKDEFLATLAHELRNPLAPIRNAVQLLRLDGNVETTQSAIEMLDRQSTQLVRLIDDLLDISRISRGKIELRREWVDLTSVVSQALEAARSYEANDGHELTVELPSEPIFLNADSIRLAQVIGNLLNNAYKFTPRGGHIRLLVEREDGDALIRVQDTGIGIAPRHLPHIFEMFSQGDTSLERSRGGLGIGLSLVQRLVELHGGTVEAHSKGPGFGTELIVRLPMSEDLIPPRSKPALDTVQAIGVSRRVLVVDDNQDAATSLAMLLKQLGCEVCLAHDGLEAVEAATAAHPQIVLLDIGLPKLNGYDAGRLIREKCPDPNLVLIALTGWGQPEDRRRSEEAGFDAHLVKPVDISALKAILGHS
jgi:PAS domain S-box-containing protein